MYLLWHKETQFVPEGELRPVGASWENHERSLLCLQCSLSSPSIASESFVNYRVIKKNFLINLAIKEYF